MQIVEFLSLKLYFENVQDSLLKLVEKLKNPHMWYEPDVFTCGLFLVITYGSYLLSCNSALRSETEYHFK